jgi:hypothetical protein
LSGGESLFMFKSDYQDEDIDAFATSMWISQVISGRTVLYEDNGMRCTDDYAKDIWVKWVCIECGQHEDPAAPGVAYDAIINSMKHLWCLAWEAEYVSDMYELQMQKLWYKEKEWSFAQQRSHGDVIQSWEVIATYEDGDQCVADDQYYILLPKHRAEVWGEWYYLWKKLG